MRTDLRSALLASVVALGLAAGACNDGKGPPLVAKQIDDPNELIGGPSSRGKLGDFLIQNDKVRFIVTGIQPAMTGGVFGGTLIDADLYRTRSDTRYGHGWDSFSDTFPLVNLIVPNPALSARDVGQEDGKLQVITVPSGVRVLKDGSDGEAIVRVEGRAGYIFELLKFLDKDFLQGFLGTPISFGSFDNISIVDLLDLVLHVDVYALLNRLQTDFRFRTDYILEKGRSYLTIRTTLFGAPPSDDALGKCPEPAEACTLDCPNGYAFDEVKSAAGDDAKVLCPVCACADEPIPMVSINESEDIFGIMLGDLGPWKEKAWKGGLLGGDFLFFGKESDIFSPGLGFDEDRRIFENMWQQLPTLASPLTFDWVAAKAENVSYAWASTNPDHKDGAECRRWRLALLGATYDDEEDYRAALMDQLGYPENEATTRVRQLVVEKQPLVLADVAAPAAVDTDAELADWLDELPASTDIAVKGGGTKTAAQLFGKGARVGAIPALECQRSKVLIPLFTTSATAVMTHKASPEMTVDGGTARDAQRVFTFERYLVVGGGDIGSTLETVFALKDIPNGHVSGVVVDEKTGAPVRHASVFAIRDPRKGEGEAAFDSYEALIAACREVYGNEGIVSHMETDLGLDPVVDGDYAGPLAAGSYFLVTFTDGRGVSDPVPLTLGADQHKVVNLTIPSSGEVRYVIRDAGGVLLPSRLSFISLDSDGEPMNWDGNNRVELGGHRYDHGVHTIEQTSDGQGTVELPAGRYEVYVSRGFEYGVYHVQSFQVLAGQQVPLDVQLTRQVDTSGWIAGDFHVHQRPSVDSGLSMEDRITGYLAEGVEFLTATDHDILTDYRPYIHELNAEPFTSSVVGVELSTLEFGHFNGYPMRYDETNLPVHGAPPWYGRPLDEAWQAMRELAASGTPPEDFMVQVNHPRDGLQGYFSAFGLRGYDLERDTPGLGMCNPQTQVVPCDFDALEIMNEKRFELIRTPTIAEIHMHNDCLAEIFAATHPDQFQKGATAADSVCGKLREAPSADCASIEQTLAQTSATGMELAELYSVRDHCRWHAQLDSAFAACTPETDLLTCKKLALDALKLLVLRYELERMPDEQDAYLTTSVATDVGCSWTDAQKGCVARPDTKNDGEFLAGCAEDETDICSCQPCVCAVHPECCQSAADGGTGWTDACAAACDSECFGCGLQPCTDHMAIFDDWIFLLNAGFNVTGVANSDSHGLNKEVGLPRTWVRSSTDYPRAIDKHEIFTNMKAKHVLGSTGPFVRFSLGDARIGDTVSAPEGDTLPLRIRVETPSWFGVDHIVVYRNGRIEKVVRVDPEPAATVDFDGIVEVERPAEDSWYLVVAYGLDDGYLLNPVYKRSPLGVMLIPTIIAMGARSILISFPELMNELGPYLDALGMDITTLLSDALGSSELPDVQPMFPWAFTNPIWVDLDGDGFEPPNGMDADGDGVWDLPPFCSRPCEPTGPETDADGDEVYGQAGCGANQQCVPNASGGGGRCVIPIPAGCVGEQVETAQ